MMSMKYLRNIIIGKREEIADIVCEKGEDDGVFFEREWMGLLDSLQIDQNRE
ncbi:hypothetical protein AALB16_00960 [Lachnospiraceae bacterium 62-35]